MKVLCLLLVLGLSMTYALPPRYRAGPIPVFDDDDADDAEVDDDVEDDTDMYTFPTGGPGGPPNNMYLDEPSRQGRESVSQPSSIYYASETDIPEGVIFTYDDDDAPTGLVTRGGRQDTPEDKDNDTVQDEEEEEQDNEEEEDEEEDDDAEQSDDGAEDEPSYAVPDLNKLFPNPDNRPRGPGSYQQYLNHIPKKQEGQGQQQQSSGGPPQRGAPPPSRHYSQGYQGRVPPPPPARRYRIEAEQEYPVGNYLGGSGPVALDEDSVIVDAPAYGPQYYRSGESEEDDDAEDDAEDEEEEEAADDVDFSVPAYETLFPNPDKKATPGFYGNMKTSWNNAPQPPRGVNGQGRILRLFQSPMHDSYNPEYVIDPTIAMNRRNERMRYRYSDPNWRMRNIQHPWNYKPIIYQRGHYGDPREHDYNPKTGDHYLGGIYNGKNYY